jgi:hypothetical protein
MMVSLFLVFGFFWFLWLGRNGRRGCGRKAESGGVQCRRAGGLIRESRAASKSAERLGEVVR